MSTLKIIIAPDSFKGSITSTEAAKQIENGVRTVWPNVETVCIPMADGGEGTVDALLSILNGDKVTVSTSDPLGRPIEAHFGWLADSKIAVIETAAASGLPLLSQEEQDPYLASTYGTGILIRAALDLGAKKIIVGIGGSATVDAGTGCFQALGVKFFDCKGVELSGCGASLGLIDAVDLSGLHPRCSEVQWTVASDVTNHLLGPEGAVYVFGPQKGVKAELLEEFEQAMSHYAKVITQAVGRDNTEVPGSGAAGGFGFSLISFLSAEMRSGFDILSELSNLDNQIKDSFMVVTGEGKFDSQSLYGKVPVSISRIARKYDVPVIVLAGQVEDGWTVAEAEGIQLAYPIVNAVMSLTEAMENGASLLKKATILIFKTLNIGNQIKIRNE